MLLISLGPRNLSGVERAALHDAVLENSTWSSLHCSGLLCCGIEEAIGQCLVLLHEERMLVNYERNWTASVKHGLYMPKKGSFLMAKGESSERKKL